MDRLKAKGRERGVERAMKAAAEKLEKESQEAAKKIEAQTKAEKMLRTVLGWPWASIPEIMGVFFLASRMTGIAKILVYAYFSAYKRLVIPTISVLSSEVAVEVIKRGTLENKDGLLADEFTPFKAMVVAFSFYSFIWKWAAVLMKPKRP